MATKVDGGPAFPIVGSGEDNQPVCLHFGMRLVDFFAAHVAGGLASDPNYGEPRDVARLAYHIAEAMVLRRKGGDE